MDMKNKNVKPIVLVVTHTNDVLVEGGCFKPILVNHKLRNIPLNWLKDNVGDNISSKNANFCELTAMYWAWKNLSDEYTHVGLFHYRRGLSLKPGLRKYLNFKYYVNNKVDASSHINDKFLHNLAIENKVNLPKKEKMKISISDNYCERHLSKDWEALQNILSEKLSDFGDIETFFREVKHARWGNMFFMPRKIFDEYCLWLFEILFELEERVSISKDPYQSRVFGFVSERLLTLYFDKLKKFDTNDLPYVFYKFNKD